MTIQELQLHHQQRPFEPFRIMVADGRAFDVHSPEQLAQNRGGRMISVATAAGFVILDLLLVTGLEKPIPRRRNGVRRSA